MGSADYIYINVCVTIIINKYDTMSLRVSGRHGRSWKEEKEEEVI